MIASSMISVVTSGSSTGCELVMLRRLGDVTGRCMTCSSVNSWRSASRPSRCRATALLTMPYSSRRVT
ncbi:hypothetical protein [Blastococcus brunescens]|uniref:Secreted protein n=1 Tax=Blastococcus brunescens TaxID=1564165 RepID=A0ABZ1AYT5_9ACTN|nr:hypothetical protein [Blastococcus sp. BMG 8361]WRL63733.1 hypothetical protein U6N30_29475 [Blastococcus sp. BMG 8361]